MLESFGEWCLRAKCRGVIDDNAFFDSQYLNKKFCQDCPVISECLIYAVAYDEVHGVWGGMGPKQRKDLDPTLVSYIRYHFERSGQLLRRVDLELQLALGEIQQLEQSSPIDLEEAC